MRSMKYVWYITAFALVLTPPYANSAIFTSIYNIGWTRPSLFSIAALAVTQKLWLLRLCLIFVFGVAKGALLVPDVRC